MPTHAAKPEHVIDEPDRGLDDDTTTQQPAAPNAASADDAPGTAAKVADRNTCGNTNTDAASTAEPIIHPIGSVSLGYRKSSLDLSGGHSEILCSLHPPGASCREHAWPLIQLMQISI